MSSDKAIFKTSPAVFYRNVDGKVFLRNVATRRVYTYNAVVGDILDILQKPHTISETLAELKKLYRINNEQTFCTNVTGFIDRLHAGSIVECTNMPVAEKPLRVKAPCEKLTPADQKHNFLSAVLEITNRCNQRCRHCYLNTPVPPEKNSELDIDDYRKLIDELARMNCLNVLITGGEPTLHKDFLDICSYVISKRMLLDIFTNGLDMSDNIFESLCDLHINSISFSLYGGSPEFHDSITQVKGSFEKTLLNLLKFKAAGVDLYVKTVLFKDHYDEFLKLEKLAERLNFKVSASTFLLPTRSGDELSSMMQSDEEYCHFLQHEIESSPHGLLIPHRDINQAVCTAGRSSLAIMPNGDIRPCASVPLTLGNIRRDSLREVWHSEMLNDFYKLKFSDISSECANCRYSDYCSVCLGAAYDPSSGRLTRQSYTCKHARLRCEQTEKYLKKYASDKQ